MEKILIGRGTKDCYLLSNKLNQHGLIAGATGTGKTVTLKVMAENFSKMGVPVILSDVKGDLTNLVNSGEMNDKLSQRLETLDIKNFEFSNFPVRLWDVYAEKGLPLRVSVSEMGSLMLSRIMDLNEAQSGVLNIAFKIADENGLLLLDLKDLKSILKLMQNYSKDFSEIYGSIPTQTISAIQRRLLLLEDNGANVFFTEPSIAINDLIQVNSNGLGMINIINSQKLINNPTVYSMFLLYLLSELFEMLPEVGNPEKPKLVFFFDEAHLLFDNLPKVLQDKIEQVVRLIRSKGVGVFFVTQNPLDIPDKISSQLGNRVLHQLRAFSPSELKVIDSVSKTFRQNDELDLKKEITNLKTGEALISFLSEDGNPEVVEKALILPPKSSFNTLSDSEINQIITGDILYTKYINSIDRESAYEVLEKKLAQAQKQDTTKTTKNTTKNNNSPTNQIFNSFLRSMTRQIGSSLARGLIGTLKKL